MLVRFLMLLARKRRRKLKKFQKIVHKSVNNSHLLWHLWYHVPSSKISLKAKNIKKKTVKIINRPLMKFRERGAPLTNKYKYSASQIRTFWPNDRNYDYESSLLEFRSCSCLFLFLYHVDMFHIFNCRGWGIIGFLAKLFIGSDFQAKQAIFVLVICRFMTEGYYFGWFEWFDHELLAILSKYMRKSLKL